MTRIGGSISSSQVETRAATLASRVDEASGTVTYLGKAEVAVTTNAASWQIKRLTESGTETITEWADGDDLFDNVWDDRATLSYS